MTLGERIREQRKARGMSQEMVAGHLGVSRQAVAKWESGQSAPSAENLHRLAELLGTTAGSLLDSPAVGSGAAEQAYALLRAEREAERRRSRRRRNLLAALAVAGAYLVIYLLGRIFGTAPGSYSLAGWLFGNDPQQLSYLYGWLLRQKLFWAALLISALPALWGKYRFSATASIGFALGLALGELAGPNPAGALWGHGHDGWAIWGGCFLLSLAMGGVLERLSRRGLAVKSRAFLLWCALFVLGTAAVVLLVKWGTPVPTGS
ncbi:helix-turn-helix transcriptional regulator [Flavonifractor sp. An10]|uniref:helix-turn-helix domain-containing protein n=1 Tax=Flavonifractor sp. An10 TaxID=1965537 RepID=UPI000B36FB08|nr:helix-turn-helix transcriptional regulator [Flavonifractor sp. An10]